MIVVAPFIRLIKNPIKFRLFLWSKLPAAWYAGLRVHEMSAKHCVVSVPYKWFTRNPFRSTYFACLMMAGEMSTGALAMAHLYRRKPSVALLVVKVESDFFKKATDRATFTCEEGDGILAAIEETTRTGEPTSFRAKTTGRNKEGEVIAEMWVTWSFKRRSNS
jgi:hypothetical protein